MSGDSMRYAETTAGHKVLFCTSCKVDQSKIGKNVQSAQNGKVREKVAAQTKGQTKQIASLLTKEKAEAPSELLSKKDKALIAQGEEAEEESTDILGKNGTAKAYCSKCKKQHLIGSRRYERHIHFIKKNK
jgi:hypothetical protein